jgi:hypothetical protein
MDPVGSGEQIFRKTPFKGTIKIIDFTKDSGELNFHRESLWLQMD